MATSNYRQINSEENIIGNNSNNIRVRSNNHVTHHKSTGHFLAQKHYNLQEENEGNPIDDERDSERTSAAKERSPPKESRKCCRNSSCNLSSNSNSNQSEQNSECCQSERSALSYIRGSDPSAGTCRGKLQNRRIKLNQDINKELRLRAGAENLFKVITNRKLRDTVALELNFVNSNLQLLKEQLADLNSSVEVYHSTEGVMPMIPLGLKETNDINFLEPFSDFILEHYSEDPLLYVEAIADITDTRKAARTPSRDQHGVALLFRYYNLLYYVERRFFPSDRSLGVYFEWYDSLTGVPSCQRTIAFEKACCLFNLGAICTQIAAKHDRTDESGLDAAVEGFLHAAGIFQHIFDTFTNAPSMDLKPQVLNVLVTLMSTQARECLFEKMQLKINPSLACSESQQMLKTLAGEAAQLTFEYRTLHRNLQNENGCINLPEYWNGLVILKAEFYKAMAHYYEACAIHLKPRNKKSSWNKALSVRFLDSELEVTPVQGAVEKYAHLREALASNEESQRLQRICRQLKNKPLLGAIIQEAYYRIQDELDKLKGVVTEKDVTDYQDTDLQIEASTKFILNLSSPDFMSYTIEDPFRSLGPIAIFSAHRHWTAPRSIRLQKDTCKDYSHPPNRRRHSSHFESTTDEMGLECNTAHDVHGYGFHLHGSAPVMISHIYINSLADLAGMKEGDFVVSVAGTDVKWSSQEEVLHLIRSRGSILDLKVITPMDRNFIKPTIYRDSTATLSMGSSSSVSSGGSSMPTRSHSKSKHASQRNFALKTRLNEMYAMSWNPFRRSTSLAKIL